VTGYLIDILAALAKEPSAVPLGPNTLIAPDDPTLVRYVQEVLRPQFIGLGACDVLDLPLNQFAVRFGNGAGPCLALTAYTPTQHHNLMSDPWSGRIRTPVELGIDEPCLFGQGVTQNKVHQACLLSLAKWLVEEAVTIDGTLLLCVNNEGRSTHDCSTAMLDALPVKPDLMIQLFNSSFDVHVGNRGRIDIYVHVRGQATHSSSPHPTGRVISTVGEVLRRIEALDEKVRTAVHPLLGPEQAVPYQVFFEPLAPHTLPDYAKVTVDRRILPGSDPQAAADQLAEALGDLTSYGCEVEVEAGVTMLPAQFPSESVGLLDALDGAIREHLQVEPTHAFYGGSFDAGGPLDMGIPTVMFGAPIEGTVLGDDFVRLSVAHTQDAVLKGTVKRFFAVS
jgi:acetylornithine deacetylase/succinyl-diaminopimelate desuccinylase-like protein